MEGLYHAWYPSARAGEGGSGEGGREGEGKTRASTECDEITQGGKEEGIGREEC